MPKVNFILDEDVREELVRIIPRGQRSRLVNEAIKKELLRMKRAQALSKLLDLRKKSATFSAREIQEALRKDRSRS